MRSLLPNVSTTEIKGGNHWGILNGDIDISTEGLDESLTPVEVQTKMATEIANFAFT